jgi:hypothetical protein
MPTWGRTSAASTNDSGTINSTFRGMGGTSPNTDGMTLDSVSVYLAQGSGGEVRVAVYTGGALDNPAGATLLEDLGVVSLPSTASPAFTTVNSVSNPAIPKNAPLWIMAKNDGGGVTAYWYTSSAGAGDFQTARGRVGMTGATNGVADGSAYPNPLDGTAAFASAWYPFYLTYSEAVSGPTITVQPVAQQVREGTTATFTVAATGTGTLAYAWTKNGTAIGTDSATLAFTAALGDNTASIVCEVTDDNGTTATTPATLTVTPSPRVLLSFRPPA